MSRDGVDVEVTIVVPARDEEALLPACLASLAGLEPCGGPVEVIVVDNGSRDRTPEIAREMGAIVIPSRAGTIAAVRNRGVSTARGRFLAFIDADCAADPSWLRRALPHFSAPDVVGVGSHPLAPAGGGSWLQDAWAFLSRRPPSSPRRVAWLPTSNLVVRASAFRQVGGFDEAFETCEDADLCYRLRPLGAIVDDDAVRVVHLRLPRTLGQFFRLEVWHGKGSYEGIRRGRLVPDELPSLVSPIVSLAGALLLHAGLVLGPAGRGRPLLWGGAAGLLTVPLLYVVRTVLSKGRLPEAPKFLLVYTTYCLARGTALLLWILGGLRRARRGSEGPPDGCPA